MGGNTKVCKCKVSKICLQFPGGCAKIAKDMEMQGWRIVVIYTADREKKLTAESFFQIRYRIKFTPEQHRGSAFAW